MSNQHHQLFYPVPNLKDQRTAFNQEAYFYNSITPNTQNFDVQKQRTTVVPQQQQFYTPNDYYMYLNQQRSPQPPQQMYAPSISPQPTKIIGNPYQQQNQYPVPFYETSQSAPPQQIFSSDNSFDSQSTASMNMNQWKDKELDKVVMYILQLRDPEKRESALAELSKKRESFPNLAPLLWTSIGTIAIFLQEIAQIYTCLSPPNLNPNQSSRICNVLGLLQCLALHQQTRSYFLKAHLPLFLYPFLNTSNKSKAFENLRVTSLGVIGALVKGDDTDAINFLMQTEIIPLCLRIMKKGQELSRTVATFIVQKILLDDNGLRYICETPERFFAVSTVLQNMIDDLHQNGKDDQRLLRHIIRCYLRLSENNKAGEVLKKYLPEILKDPSQQYIKDEVVRKWHINLLKNLLILPNDN